MTMYITRSFGPYFMRFHCKMTDINDGFIDLIRITKLIFRIVEHITSVIKLNSLLTPICKPFNPC